GGHLARPHGQPPGPYQRRLARTIEIYSTSPSAKEDVLVVGNLGGVFAMRRPDKPGANWTRLGDGLPHALTLDLHYDYTDNLLLAGTLGRGAWTLNNPFASDGALPAASVSGRVAADGRLPDSPGRRDLPAASVSGQVAAASPHPGRLQPL